MLSHAQHFCAARAHNRDVSVTLRGSATGGASVFNASHRETYFVEMRLKLRRVLRKVKRTTVCDYQKTNQKNLTIILDKLATLCYFVFISAGGTKKEELL